VEDAKSKKCQNSRVNVQKMYKVNVFVHFGDYFDVFCPSYKSCTKSKLSIWPIHRSLSGDEGILRESPSAPLLARFSAETRRRRGICRVSNSSLNSPGAGRAV
jgi:hypothetical protein